MYLLDTNICTAVMNDDRQAISVFNRMFPQCYTSTIVVAELYKGVRLSRLVEQNLRSLNQLTELLDVKAFDSQAAAEFGKIQQELREQGRATGEMDALIPAVARSQGDKLVTNNTRDFLHIPNLALEDWLKMD